MTNETIRQPYGSELKPWYKSKTVIFGILLACFGGVQQYLPQLQADISPTAYNQILFWSGLLVGVLRFITTQPIK